MRLNHADVIPGRGCLCGVVGSMFPDTAVLGVSQKTAC